MKRRIKHYNWTGLYDQSWKGSIVPGAFVHPAKYSRALIRRIYEFMFEQKWLKEGDTVLDMFGGVGLGALDALTMGLNWTGIELESRFVALAQENIALWDKRYKGRLPRWGTAQIIQGDSRHLLDVIAGAGAITSSPPYFDPGNSDHRKSFDKLAAGIGRNDKRERGPINRADYGTTPGQLAALREGDVHSVISSPVYLDARGGSPSKGENIPTRYGSSIGQLGSMPEGDAKAVISSPPYAEHQSGGGIAVTGTPHERRSKNSVSPDGYQIKGVVASPPYSAARVGDECGQEHVGHNGNYGTSAGQLGAMAEGVVSSPPFEDNATKTNGKQGAGWYHDVDLSQGMNRLKDDYGDMASMGTGETFWSAARIIVAQAYAALAPGAHAAWVLKAFVRNKAIVDFPAQWQELAESVGFETVAIARAWQTKDDGTQLATDGNHKRLTKERKGFFRRLHEKRYPETRIDFEVILFQVKP